MTEPHTLTLTPIGIIHSPHRQSTGTPIQPRFAAGASGTVEVFEPYRPALKDLDGFERVWLLYWFDRARDCQLEVVPYRDTQARGLFATRAPSRPNPLGLSSVRLERVEGSRLIVSELDCLDGTPLLDIKPYSPVFDAFPQARSGWLDRSGCDTTTADERFGHNDGSARE